jgi:spermidine synthase
MIPWVFLGSAQVPGSSKELRLYSRGKEYSIRIGNCELMNSRVYGSEDALAELTCARIADRKAPAILIGGLGMGYTLAAALRRIGPEGRVAVAELVPAVVEWNRGPLAELAGRPLADKRVTVLESDVAEVILSAHGAYDAILLDVDNGPEGLTRKVNDRIYDKTGLEAAYSALRPSGVLAVWSAGTDQAFVKRLRQAGFIVEEVGVRARGKQGGAHYTIWLARRGA